MVHLVEDKKGEDILLLDISELETFTNFFVFCSGSSERQLRALQESIIESVKKSYQLVPWSREGSGEVEWFLLDYGDVIIHIFSPERRAYYDLEGLWKEGKILLHIQ